MGVMCLNMHKTLEDTGNTGCLEEGMLESTEVKWEEVFSPQPFGVL